MENDRTEAVILVTHGMKLWFWIEPCEENLRIRKYGEYGGVKFYKKVISILLGEGDSLIMTLGNIQGVYTLADTKVIVGNFWIPRYLTNSLEMADISLKVRDITNDPVPRKDTRRKYGESHRGGSD